MNTSDTTEAEIHLALTSLGASPDDARAIMRQLNSAPAGAAVLAAITDSLWLQEQTLRNVTLRESAALAICEAVRTWQVGKPAHALVLSYQVATALDDAETRDLLGLSIDGARIVLTTVQSLSTMQTLAVVRAATRAVRLMLDSTEAGTRVSAAAALRTVGLLR